MTTGYNEIANHYRQLIHDGQLAPDDPMPSLADIQTTWDVARTTANRAYQALHREGLITSKVGVGTIVAHPRTVIGGADRVDRLTRTGTPYSHRETSRDHRAHIRSINDPEICQLLDVDGDDEVVIRTRTFDRDGTPYCHALTIIRMEVAAAVPEITQDGRILDGRFWMGAYTERTGRAPMRTPEQRTARLAADYELAAFGVALPAGAAVPVLVTRSLFHDESGPVCLFEDTYAPGVWQSNG